MDIKMKAKYNKYRGDIKKINVMICIAAILDPRNKFHLVKWGLERIHNKDDAIVLCEKIKDMLYKMFDKYRLFLSEGQENSSQTTHEIEMLDSNASNEVSVAMVFKKYMNLHETMNKNEVDLYLKEGLEKKIPNFDILN
ncbi:unnamed protein product [Lupinus luteus]|uniref:hAT-like transposase RNase-H fold domain-containing protein n=1 Tax=Lupinus luteus TaxID=3873 RepID=A0AAV1X0Z3_LUPLU